MAIQWLSAVLASVEDALPTLALGFAGFDTVVCTGIYKCN